MLHTTTRAPRATFVPRPPGAAPRATLLTLALAVAAACGDPPGPAGAADVTPRLARHDETTHYGATVRVGRGRARTYLTLAGGRPTEFGIALTEDALTGLPPAPDGDPAHYHEYRLPAPPRNPTPYRFVGLDWNPAGHPDPTHVYDKPHFDFHFYTIDEAAQDAMTPDDPRFLEKGTRLPGPEYVPPGYFVPVLDPVPRMGLHWLDRNAPELSGAPWTTTLLLGSWDGRMIFIEPMITLAFLRAKPDVTLPVPQPQRYAAAGHYPTRYRVRWDADAQEYRVSLGGFTWRE